MEDFSIAQYRFKSHRPIFLEAEARDKELLLSAIKTARNEGLSIRVTALGLGVSRSTVARNWNNE